MAGLGGGAPELGAGRVVLWQGQIRPERYARIREIAAEILAFQGDMPLEKVKDLFCCETGYQTPKLATRAAVFQGERILLVQEPKGWALPEAGWTWISP